MLEQWLTYICSRGGIHEIIPSGDASEGKGGEFNETCRKHRIKHEFMSADGSQLNGVAGRGLCFHW